MRRPYERVARGRVVGSRMLPTPTAGHPVPAGNANPGDPILLPVLWPVPSRAAGPWSRPAGATATPGRPQLITI